MIKKFFLANMINKTFLAGFVALIISTVSFNAFSGTYIGGSANYTNTRYKFGKTQIGSTQSRTVNFSSRQIALQANGGYVIPSDALIMTDINTINNITSYFINELQESYVLSSRIFDVLRSNYSNTMPEFAQLGANSLPSSLQEFGSAFLNAPSLLIDSNYNEQEIASAFATYFGMTFQNILAREGVINIAPNGDVTVIDATKIDRVFNCNGNCLKQNTAGLWFIVPDNFQDVKPEIISELQVAIETSLYNMTSIPENIQTELNQINEFQSIKSSGGTESVGLSALIGYSFFNDSKLWLFQTEGVITSNFIHPNSKQKELRVRSFFGADIMLRGGIKLFKDNFLYINTGMGYRLTNINYNSKNINIDNNYNALSLILGGGIEVKTSKKIGIFVEYNHHIPLNKVTLSAKEDFRYQLKDFKTTASDFKIGARWYL